MRVLPVVSFCLLWRPWSWRAVGCASARLFVICSCPREAWRVRLALSAEIFDGSLPARTSVFDIDPAVALPRDAG